MGKDKARRRSKSYWDDIPWNPWPIVPRDAEIVLKETLLVDATGRKDYAVPELQIIANRKGFLYLAEIFSAMADRKDLTCDNHQHLGRLKPPFSLKLSDDLEFTLRIFDHKTRAEVFDWCGVAVGNAARGSLIKRYRRIIALARREEARAKQLRPTYQRRKSKHASQRPPRKRPRS